MGVYLFSNELNRRRQIGKFLQELTFRDKSFIPFWYRIYRNTGYNLRKNDTQDLVPNFSRTDGFKYSFFNRVVDEWNGLPNHIRESNSIATLKKMF